MDLKQLTEEVETVSHRYAERNGFHRDATWFLLKLQEEVGELNIAAGATYGYLLCWVVVGANLMAVLVQYLAAKASIATGRTLPQLCRDHFRRSTSTGLWAQAELVAVATDLAEVVGGAIALNLLFGIPLLLGGAITGAVSFGLTGIFDGSLLRSSDSVIAWAAASDESRPNLFAP